MLSTPGSKNSIIGIKTPFKPKRFLLIAELTSLKAVVAKLQKSTNSKPKPTSSKIPTFPTNEGEPKTMTLNVIL
jgi:hypothetical protein